MFDRWTSTWSPVQQLEQTHAIDRRAVIGQHVVRTRYTVLPAKPALNAEESECRWAWSRLQQVFPISQSFHHGDARNDAVLILFDRSKRVKVHTQSLEVAPTLGCRPSPRAPASSSEGSQDFREYSKQKMKPNFVGCWLRGMIEEDCSWGCVAFLSLEEATSPCVGREAWTDLMRALPTMAYSCRRRAAPIERGYLKTTIPSPLIILHTYGVSFVLVLSAPFFRWGCQTLAANSAANP